MEMNLFAVGYIKTEFTDRKDCPKQGHEGGVDAEVVIEPEYSDALNGLEEGTKIILLTWFHKSGRNYLEVHPRGDKSRPQRGVFATRSPDRPNPIGLHEVTIKKNRRQQAYRLPA